MQSRCLSAVGVGLALSAAGVASGQDFTFHVDLNTLSAAVTPDAGVTEFDINYSGELRVFNADFTTVLLAEWLGDAPINLPDSTGFSFEIVMDIVNGDIMGGTMELVASDNRLFANLIPAGNLFDADLAEIKFIAEADDANVDNVGAADTFFGLGDMDRFAFMNGFHDATGDALNLTVVPDPETLPSLTPGVEQTFDDIVNIDVFVNTEREPPGEEGEKCIWDNGRGTGLNGQTSEVDTAIEDSRAADDFILKDGYVYRIDCIYVDMIVRGELRDVTLQLYEDCNGCPSDLLACGFFTQYEIVEETELSETDTLVRYKFITAERTEIDEYGEFEIKPGLWLHGGHYWLSPVGQGDGTQYQQYFWSVAETGDAIGSIPKAQSGDFKIDGWTPVDTLNLDCANFAFDLEGDCCCVLCDNGKPDFSPSGFDLAFDTTQPFSYNADNFVVPNCEEPTEVCFVKGYILTNCDPERTKLKIYGDECDDPSSQVRGFRFVDKVIQRTETGAVTVNVQDGPFQRTLELTGYEVQWHDLRWSLDAGQNYWLSIYLQGTGSVSERAFWTFNQDCVDPSCLIKLSEGQWNGVQTNGDWESVSEFTDGSPRDFAFKIAIREPSPEFENTGTDPGVGTCAADYNNDGEVMVTDLLDFLSIWFNGCDE